MGFFDEVKDAWNNAEEKQTTGTSSNSGAAPVVQLSQQQVPQQDEVIAAQAPQEEKIEDSTNTEQEVSQCASQAIPYQVNQVSQEVVSVQWGGWLVIQDGHVGGKALGQFAHADTKLALDDVGVIPQEQLWRFHESHTWVAVIETVEQVSATHL